MWSRDRGWMYEMTNSEGFYNLNFGPNVDKFLDFAFSNDDIVEKKETSSSSGELVPQIKCPCSRCKNIHFRKRSIVERHLLGRGFMPNYYTWDEHGETSIQEVGQSSTAMDDDNEDDNEDDDYRRMVLDSMYPSGNNPTFQSNVDSNTREEYVPNPEAKKFYDMLYDAEQPLLYDAEQPLWEGCTDWSKLQASTSLLNWKSHCNVPTSTFNFILPIFKSMLPKGNNLSENFYEVKKSLQALSIPKKRYDACKNHCMLFYNEEDLMLTHCRWCGESRYKNVREKIPHLVLTYLPIGPRLQKLYMSKKTAKDMTWHSDHKTKEGSMVHPSDGKAWKHFDSEDPIFA